ncbi:MAG: sigma-70 family RNA polymerase sigma factor [Bacteroidetes bacterium]|nr:sigma-70 family RNA polymerase sigma factor [Bacteroidota bacterium]
MKLQDDSEIIERVLNGDVSAYAALVQKHKNLVFSIVLKVVNNREDAEEIAQDTFLKAYQSLKTFERKSKFSTWLYRIAYNSAISKTRKKRLEMVAIEESVITNYSPDEVSRNMDELEENDRQVILEKALQRLPEEDNLLITLFYKGENSVDNISEITGLSVSNVKVRLHRIRKKLYEEMQGLMISN